ncbi:hypothetical protein BpHYR1_008166 [Brachionus plicatilis]|uniref:Uncharacterized protein n=1 Tax=Brachionus plicatilis TaxID=10195 RepID=A0A3M7PS73_BRAPC|nr:hypothetical protein BpHYR1_008166 [Brachionus plicatilis]
MDLGAIGSGNFISNENLPNLFPIRNVCLPNSNSENFNTNNLFGLNDQFNNLGILNSQNCMDAEPIVINQDVFVPQPVVVKQVFVPKPYLPYSRWHKNGFPCFCYN